MTTTETQQEESNKIRSGRVTFLSGCVSGILITILFIITSVGGLLYYLHSNSPSQPNPDFEPSMEAATAFVENTDAVAITDDEGILALRIDEEGASSWMNLLSPILSEQGIPFENMQAVFDDGQVIIYTEIPLELGIVVAGEFVFVVEEAYSDISVTLVDSNVGGFGVPARMNDAVTGVVELMLQNIIFRVGDIYSVSSITVDDGQFEMVVFISGRVIG